MGVGVAGLQAIATARRLGAQVSATDVRSATREQIRSLGAKPIFVEGVAGIEGEGTGGYAGETSEEYRAAQGQLVAGHIARQDIVITTALDPRPPAPPGDGCAGRDDAAGQRHRRPGGRGGRQCRGRGGGEVTRHGVTIIGHRNMPGRLAADASALLRATCTHLPAASGTRTPDAWKATEIGDAIR
jgi:NAD(P) transhydrogenase subunit alpha